ncbi:MAG: HNH endonuclease [Candidatus Hydrothermarchaeales archaeon]
MKEANIAEMTKRNILANAGYRCEVCGVALGYGKEEQHPQFYFIIPIVQGGEKKETNVAVLCPSDGEGFKEIERDLLLRKAMYREMAEPDT